MSRVRCGMMAGMPGEYRLYQELADWWPLISPPGEYAAEAAYLAGLFDTARCWISAVAAATWRCT
jgi:hypothetical protein